MNPSLHQLTTAKTLTPNKVRIESVDVLRGLVMVIMALDHTRDLFHSAAFANDPLNLASTTPALYFTRWVTHFCAPIFVFLSGTSIYLQSLRKTKKELSRFLIQRGLWLIVAELTIITLGITFNPFYNVLILQVIWVIGISMVILGLLIYLPFRLILALGLAIVLGHNLLDASEAAPGFKPNVWWSLLHQTGLYPYAPNYMVLVSYPLAPWLGLMLLGYCIGTFFKPTVSPTRRRTVLTRMGLGLIAFFIVLRFSGIYGDPLPWSQQKDSLFTLLSFLNVQKYPPSLLYMCITIGPALLFLATIEPVKNRFTRLIGTFGRTAFFYYIAHWYLLHTVCLLVFLMRGHSLAEAAKIPIPIKFVVPGEGFSLPVVYLIWATLILILYPLCRWYDAYKTAHKEQWWLSYL
ncbi:heparan-alpha-glucosaminide N-acetyltransferase domain-containing protein [Nibrella viscosa]|uniref:Heparan-alpha-glucosaminide N-acetyltransferase domain-containing protein n=1 Tax=Nibrella viscosa TaxID=1084524 RepID=A0ABP8K763_9BACT